MRHCNICDLDKSLNEFHVNARWCKPCKSERDREYREKNRERLNAAQSARYWADPEKARAVARDAHEKHKARRNPIARDRARNRTPEQKQADKERYYFWRYGITLDERDAMLAAQGGCAICGTDTPGGQGWATDHDHACCDQRSHSCGRCIRGILCFACNTALGNFNDDLARLNRAVEYLQFNQSTHAVTNHQGET